MDVEIGSQPQTTNSRRFGLIVVAALITTMAGLAFLVSDRDQSRAQTVTLVATGAIVWWYTIETQKLRKIAERQVAATIEATRSSYRPYLIADVQNSSIRVRNVGVGPALMPMVEVVSGPNRVPVPDLEIDNAGPDEIRAGSIGDWAFSYGGHTDLSIGSALLLWIDPEDGPLRIILSYRDLGGKMHRTISQVSRLYRSAPEWQTEE